MSRKIYCEDALIWLKKHKNVGAIVTGIPDAQEIGMEIEPYREWFTNASKLCMLAVSKDAPIIFSQTDRKADGGIVSKSHLLISVANSLGFKTLWHKIILRRDVGLIDIHRPGYSHLLAFSAECGPGKATPDVIHGGKTVYDNGLGINAALFAVRFAMQYSRTICDPFCGRGTALAVADALGADAIGVDIDPSQVEFAKKLRIKPRE